VRIDFSNPIEHRSLEKPKKRLEKMLSFLAGFEYRLSPEGAVVFFGNKAYLVPYETLYQKSTSSKKAVKDITYNLRTGRFYREIVNQNFKEIGFRELLFIFLKKTKFLPDFLDVFSLVEDVELASRDLGVEAIFDFGRLRFLFRCCQKTLVDFSYETLRDRYLGKEEKIEKLKKNILSKAISAIEEKRKNEALQKKGIEVRNRVFSYLQENKLKLVDSNFQFIKQKVSLICSCGRTFDYHLNVLLQYKVP